MSDLDRIIQQIEQIEGVDRVLRIGRKDEYIGVYVPELGNCNMAQVNIYHKVEAEEAQPTLGIKVEDGVRAKAIFNPGG